jgi:hypothetical protein
MDKSSTPAHFIFFFNFNEAFQTNGKGSFWTKHSETVPITLSPISIHLTGYYPLTIVIKTKSKHQKAV